MRLLRALAPATCVLAVLVTRPAPFAALRTGAENTLHRTLGEDNIVCRVYLDPHDKFTRVVAPERAALAWTGAAEAEAILSTISVNYTGFTLNAPAQAAFQAAVDIWKTQVASTVPIVIDANFQDLGNPLLLGQAGSGAVSDFLHAPRAGTWFPFPLANKLAGSDQGA